MRKYLGGGSNMGGGSGMLRSVHRAVRGGIGGAPPDPFSPSAGSGFVSTSTSRKTKRSRIKQPSSPNRNLNLSNSSSNNNNNGSSAFSSLINLPISAASGAATPAWGACSSPTCDDLEWEYVEGSGGDEKAAARAFYDDFVFTTVPSRDEVKHAVSALQQVAGIQCPNEELADDSGTNFPSGDRSPMGATKSISSDQLELDWVESFPHLCDYKMLQPQGSQRVYDAFHLLQTDPSVERMVISLSSDKAVWEAVLNNDDVRELKSSITQVDEEVRESAEASPDDGSNPLKDIMDWVFNNASAKIMELINKMTEIVHDIFHPSDEGERDCIMDPVEKKLRTSLLLSVVVLLIVVISRVQSA
ncbi:uncharacterized protein LOC142539381 [Primulina tabacum]|uniref:uncharacterized protein LOC142539381 n=1 Tax=Primulina tabacum TaxID=48773 RepID=UPI003F590E72